MRRVFATIVAVMVLALLVAAPVFAATPDATGANGAGQAFGEHHAGMAQDMGGFTGTDNPGVHHQGFSDWPGI